MDVMAVIEEALRESSALLREFFGKELEVNEKADRSLVTSADLASDRYLREFIAARYPHDAVITEETSQTSRLSHGQSVWIIDPLDGTTNFANRYPFFSVSIARAVFGADQTMQVMAGGVADVVHSKLYLAERGSGAHVDGRRLRVAESRSLSDAFLVTGFYYSKGAALREDVRRFGAIAEVSHGVRRDGSAALDLALVADGVFDGFWERGLQIWDVAAGSLLVHEAGGRVVNYPKLQNDSSGFRIDGEGLLAGSSSIVDQLLAATDFRI